MTRNLNKNMMDRSDNYKSEISQSTNHSMRRNWLASHQLSASSCVVFMCLVLLASGASNSPTWSTSTDFQAGTVTICSNGYTYGGLYTGTYATAFSAAPNVGISVPSIDISPGLNEMLWKINLPQSTNTTNIKIAINYVNTVYKTFKVSYLAVSGNLTYLKVGYFELGMAQINPLVSGAGTRSITNTINLTSPLSYNSSSNVSIIPYLSGLKIYTTSGDRGFSLTLTKNNDTSVFANTTCIGTTTVTEVVSYILFYDITLGEATQEVFLDYAPLTASNNALNAVSLVYYNPVNMLVGAYQFYFTNGFSFNLDTSTLSLTVPTAGATFTNMTFSFWSFRKRNCVAATPFYEKTSNLCYDICPTGYYGVTTATTKYCQSCSSSLANCLACTSSTQCTQCAVGWKVDPVTRTCVCNDGYYLSGGSCVACSASCATCSVSSTNCTSCASGLLLSGSSCVSCSASCATCSVSTTNCTSCATGKYLAGTNCLSCDPSCTSCSGSSTNCSGCVTGKFLSGTSCLSCDPACTSCSGSSTNCSACATGKYLSGTSCLSCDPACTNCTGSSTNCSGCVLGKFLSGTSCLSCDPSCTNCTGSSTNCSACATGKYLSGTSCVSCSPSCTSCSVSSTNCSACTTGYYLSGTSCVACNPSCTSCTGSSTNCSGCVAGKFLSGTSCNSCDPSCTICTGSSTNCSACATGKYLSGTSCVSCDPSCTSCSGSSTNCSACVVGMYLSGTSCVSCDPSCTSCTGSSTNCSGCVTGKFLSGTSCLSCDPACTSCSGSSTNCSACATGKYLSGTSCLSCDPACTNCTGSSTNCSGCVLGKFLSGTSCLSCDPSCTNCTGTSTNCSACATGKYLSGTSCPSCYIGCATCSGGAASNCLTCSPGYSYLNGTCFVCDASCASCNGPSSTNCLSCYAGKTFLNGSCFACHASCATCNGPSSTNCLSCPAGVNFYNNSCFVCDSSCNTCSGTTSTSCLSCKTTSQYLSATNQCLACVSPCLTCSSATVCLSCSAGKYLTAMNTCAACDASCKTCANSPSNCTSCNTDRTLTGTTCICNSGVEDDAGNCVSLCTQSSCNSCPTNNSVCSQCKASFLLSGGRCHCPSSTYYSISNNTCYPCSSTCAICSGPTANECTGCDSTQNRELNTNTFACECKATFYAPNNELTCIKSPSTTCPVNFVYNSTSGYCVEICGDGKLFELQCDDGNTEAGDGCDANCKVESGFSCLYGDAQSPSICSYDGQISFSLVSSQKDLYSNQINLQYKLSPLLKFYQKFPNFTASLIISDPTLTIQTAVYSPQSQTLKVSVSYNQTATGKTVSISYTPASSPYSHALVGSSIDWPIRVGNGLALTYYSEDTYQKAKIYDYVVLGVFVGSLFVFVLALFFRKMIGVEMILLIQTQVISLSMLQQVHPYLAPLTVDKYAFGYNQFQYLMNLKKATTSQSVGLYSVIGFSQIFGQNLNVMLFAICVFYLLAIIVGLLSSCKQKATAKKMKQAALILAREIAFGLLLFSLMNMVTSYALETYAGTIWNYDPEYSGTIKIGSIILIAANYGVYGLFFKQSVESYVFYEKRSRLAQLQPLFIATKAILIAAGIALYQMFGVPVLYALMGLQGAYIILVIILRPFKRKIDLVRSLVVELSMLYVLGSKYVQIQFVKFSNPGDWKMFLEYGLPGEHGLVGFSLLMSLISLIFHLFKANKADAQISPEQAYSQFDAEDQKQKQKRSSKYSKQTHYPIQDFLENYLEDDRKTKDLYALQHKRRNKLYLQKEGRNNSSFTQLIKVSEGEGYDSKRKLNENNLAHSMEIIEMDD